MDNSRHYVVYKGWVPEVYSTWSTAHAQVVGFGNALYERFPTRLEAEHAYVAYLASNSPTIEELQHLQQIPQPRPKPLLEPQQWPQPLTANFNEDPKNHRKTVTIQAPPVSPSSSGATSSPFINHIERTDSILHNDMSNLSALDLWPGSSWVQCVRRISNFLYALYVSYLSVRICVTLSSLIFVH